VAVHDVEDPTATELEEQLTATPGVAWLSARVVVPELPALSVSPE
jgi:hypothetical protein